jgi:hypothetical protein
VKVKIETVIDISDDEREALGYALNLGRAVRHSEVQHYFMERIEELAMKNALAPLLHKFYTDKAKQYNIKADALSN